MRRIPSGMLDHLNRFASFVSECLRRPPVLQVATTRIDAPGILPMPREGGAILRLAAENGAQGEQNTRYVCTVVGDLILEVPWYIAKPGCLGKPTCSRALIESGARTYVLYIACTRSAIGIVDQRW